MPINPVRRPRPRRKRTPRETTIFTSWSGVKVTRRRRTPSGPLVRFWGRGWNLLTEDEALGAVYVTVDFGAARATFVAE